MKPAAAFLAERAAAQHCPELVRRGPDSAELLGAFTRTAERFARNFAKALAALDGGEEPAAAALPARTLSEGELAQELNALAAHCLLALPVPGATLLASLDGAAILRLIDRAYGGRGDAPTVLPAQFPLSAELMIDKVQTVLTHELAAAFGYAGENAVRPLRRCSALGELEPFPAGARLVAVQCEFTPSGRPPWRLTLALPQAVLAKVFGAGTGARAGGPASTGPANPAAAPFAEVPLALSALLIDMNLPLSVIAALVPGSVVPVSIARQVPLRIGERIVAAGIVGSQDDRVALQLTSIS